MSLNYTSIVSVREEMLSFLLFSQIFHKLLSLEAFVEGKAPVVKCSGEEREFIMSIRRGPLEVNHAHACRSS